MKDVLPRPCVLYQSKVSEFDPERSKVTLDSGDVVTLILTIIYNTITIFNIVHVSQARIQKILSVGGGSKNLNLFLLQSSYFTERRGAVPIF